MFQKIFNKVAIRYCFFFLFFGISISIFSQTVPAGVNPSQIEQYYQMAKSMGMSDMEIEQQAMQRGFSLADIARLRQGLSQRTSGTGATTSMGNLGFDMDTVVSRRQNGTMSAKSWELKVARDSILRFKEAFLGLRDSLPGEKGVPIFGSTLFSNENLRFEANLRIATPSNYQLGPDDELTAYISGNSSITYRAKISPEGTFTMKDFLPVYVNGLTVEQARERIIARLKEGYSGIGRGISVTVTLGNIRSIKVTITGEARKPGTYTISSLNTAFNALYLCGGPNAKGSYRSIKIIRNNKVIKTIDLYDYLIKGDQIDNILLHDQDIVHIPFRGARVQTVGETNRNNIFEMKENETLADLMTYTGGFSEQAYKATVNVKRLNDREQELLTIEQSDFAGFKLKSGDRLHVGKVLLERFSNRVVAFGAVSRAGEFSLSSVKTVKQLIEKANGLREDAFTKRAFIHRRKDNLETEVLAIPIGAILSGEAEDVPLRNRDSVFVRAIHELREHYFVTILGEVNQAGDSEYEEGMTVSDLVTMARGLKEGAIGSRIEIARRITDSNIGNTEAEYTTEIIELKIDKGLSINPNDALFKLRPFDIVYIRKSPRYQEQQYVYVVGEIQYPGIYAIVNNTERISDILKRAGGVKSSGYLAGASFFRKKNRIAIDIEKVASDPNLEGNLLLESGDSLIIPKRSETVQIVGAVLNPSYINYNKAYTFADYLSQAGGYAQNALRRRAFVTYANGYTTRSRNFLFFKSSPKIEPGAVINVPAKPIVSKNDVPLSVILGFVGPIIVATMYLLKK